MKNVNENLRTPHPRVLNAGVATFILFAYLVTQVFSEFFAGIISSEILAFILNSMLGGAVMIFASNALIPKYLKETSPTGAAWVLGRWSAIIKGIVIGLIIGVFEHVLVLFVKPHVPYKSLDHFHKIMLVPGLQQWIGVIVVVLISPAIEEMLFRGILYGGYRKSFGPVWAAVSTTLIFVGLHFPYYIYFPSNIVVFVALAMTTLWYRLRSSAIGPAIAIHVGYNLIITIVLICRHN